MKTPRIGTLTRTLATLLLVTAPALAAVTSTITTGQPTQNGPVTVKVLDVNGGLTSTATANITANMTPAQKADQIAAALNAKFLADNNNLIFSAAAAGNVVTVTKAGGGGMTVTIVNDGTGEGNNLTVANGGGNGEHWFWRFVRWVFASNSQQVPPNTATAVVAFDSPNGFGQSFIAGDGFHTVAQLQDDLSNRLAAHGYSFTVNFVADPVLGDHYEYVSQPLPDTMLTLIPGTFQVGTSPGWSDWFGTMGVSLDVDPIGTPFCFGDHSLATPCPCGNFGQAGRGCDNSAHTGGAILTAEGITNPDTVVLSASGELPSAFSIFLQGTASLSQGATFGDGVRCAGGSLKRIAVKSARNGTVAYPEGNEQGIRARSAALGDVIPAGGTRYYQSYYRDPSPSFCPAPTGNTWNVSNALAIQWQ